MELLGLLDVGRHSGGLAGVNVIGGGGLGGGAGSFVCVCVYCVCVCVCVFGAWYEVELYCVVDDQGMCL